MSGSASVAPASVGPAPIGGAAMPALQREAEPIIAFDHVSLALGGDAIYDQLTFDVRPGEFLCILGPSGCGKSTSLRLIGGLLPAGGGTITVDGRPPAEAWSDIAFVFQSPRLVPWRTALGNVLLASELRFGQGKGRGDRAARGRTICSPSSVLRAMRANTRQCCRAASASVSRSRVPSRSIPRSS